MLFDDSVGNYRKMWLADSREFLECKVLRIILFYALTHFTIQYSVLKLLTYCTVLSTVEHSVKYSTIQYSVYITYNEVLSTL